MFLSIRISHKIMKENKEEVIKTPFPVGVEEVEIQTGRKATGNGIKTLNCWFSLQSTNEN